MIAQKWWTESDEKTLSAKHKKEVMHAFARAEKLPKPKLGEMFTDVWAVKKGEQVPAVIVSIYGSVSVQETEANEDRASRELSLEGY